MSFEAVPHFGGKGVPEGFPQSHMILFGFPVSRPGQLQLTFQVYQGQILQRQLDLGLLLPPLPELAAHPKSFSTPHCCLPKDE